MVILLLIDMQTAQTASEQGLAPESIFTKLARLAVGTELQLASLPEFTTHEEYGKQATIDLVNGKKLQISNARTVGSLESTTKDSLGDMLKSSIENDIPLIVFVREEKANTGRLQKFLSIYEN